MYMQTGKHSQKDAIQYLTGNQLGEPSGIKKTGIKNEHIMATKRVLMQENKGRPNNNLATYSLKATDMPSDLSCNVFTWGVV